MLALIDMDLVVYRCAASTENEELSLATHRVEELLDSILTKVDCTEYRAFLSGAKNFRKEVYPEYKANRTQPKPKWLQACREFSINTLGAELAPENLEADDALAIYQTEDTIICSLDKDLLQIAGKHFQWEIQGGGAENRWTKPDKFTTQTALEGCRLMYEQILKGDSSDNIKGVKGLGEAKARKLLAGIDNEAAMVDICLGQYGSEEEFLMNAQCVYMLRSLDDSYLTRYEGLK
jgi:5'-3' exonuclease